MLYLVATPIGNLKDITFRAVEILKSVDYILCEDTRHSAILLNHYEIKKPLRSYHQFNLAERENEVLKDLQDGKTIALISDAGTPGISDPGMLLAKACVANQISLEAIPGPCAAIVALVRSGFDATRFQFIGFLPKKAGELQTILEEISNYPGTTICYVSPHQINKVLNALHAHFPNQQIALCRELTKRFEEVFIGCAKKLIEHYEKHPLKGEICLVFAECPREASQDWKNIPLEEQIQSLMNDEGLTKMEAIKKAAKLRGVPKREIYKLVK